jgi:glutathione peroxidase
MQSARRIPEMLIRLPVSIPVMVSALLLSAAACAQQSPAPQASACPQLLDHEFNRLQTGKPESLCQYRGKVLLIVNTASYCGYTHQYEGLEAMYRKYKDRGLVVLGFPSNDFGSQEPGSNKEIAEFCRLTYGVQFPMFEKSSVTTLSTNRLYAELREKTGQVPKWNFFKYVLDRNGKPAGTFASAVEPDNRDLVSLVEKLLADKPAS